MTNQIIQYNVMNTPWPLADSSIDCCVTSPPYWGLRQYLPDVVKLKHDAPAWILDEIEKLGIKPIDL